MINYDNEYNFLVYNDIIYNYIMDILIDIFFNEFYLINLQIEKLFYKIIL